MSTDGFQRHNRPAGLIVAGSLIGLVWVLVAVVPGIQGAPQQGTLPWKPAPGTEDQYAGDELCYLCHDTMQETFASNPHAGATAALGHPSGEITCEACHGAGMSHGDAGGDLELIPRKFGEMNTAEIGQACLACHAGSRKHANDLGSAHAVADVTCTTCHSVHAAAKPEGLMKQATPDLCFTCHVDVMVGFSAADRHGLKQGLVSCESCHSPHGSSEPAMLARPMLGGALCTVCHLDKRGPFVYQHEASTVEGCIACHTPHGSQNRFMLKTNEVFGLCVSCHLEAPMVHNLADQRYRGCTTCHAAIHGSDTHRLFFRR